MNIIRDKIEKFIRKYYIKKIITGAIMLVSIILLILLASVVIENIAWLDMKGRRILFWSIIFTIALIFIYFILFPTFKLMKIGKVITYDEAAKIIGRFFPEIKDKLLNYLQLEEMRTSDLQGNDLLIASINQKMEELKPFNFSKAVDFKTAKKHLKYASPIILIFVIILIASPTFIKQPVERIINHNVEYEKPQPYYIELLNDSLTCIENRDFTIRFGITGKQRPDNLILHFGSKSAQQSEAYMTPVDDSTYTYTFKNVRNNIQFYASSGEIQSNVHIIETNPIPAILGFRLSVDYPEYTNIEDEIIENTGTIKVLNGAKGNWDFTTKDVDGLLIISDNDVDTLKKSSKNSTNISMKTTFRENKEIEVVAYNEHITSFDTLRYNIQTIKDLPPDLQVSEMTDTIISKDLYFSGAITDDYGFSSLKFYYKIIRGDYEEANYWSQDIEFDKSLTMQRFYWKVNLDELNVQLGEGIKYYFEVCDNNAIDGYNCTQSEPTVHRRKTTEEMDKIGEQINEEIKSELGKSIEDINEMQRQFDEMLYELQNKERLSYQDKEKLENMLEQQKEMMEQLEEQRNQMQFNHESQNEYNEFSEEILKKQQKIEELFEKLLTEEMKEMMEEIQKMLEEFNKEDLNENIREYQADNEELEKMLDMSLEMYKMLEFEQEFEKTMNRLDSLSKEQERLSEKTEDSKRSELEEIKEEQDKLNDDFDKIGEQLDKLEQMNKELEKNLDIDFNDEEVSDIKGNMQEASDELESNDKKGASQKQKEASEKMKKMGEQMRQQFNDAMYSQALEDEEDVRRLLENVIHLSFKEESMIDELDGIRRDNPKYVEIMHKQEEINRQLSMIDDTLSAIGRRNYEIGAYIFEELAILRENSELSTTNLAAGSTSKAKKYLQMTMTSLNKFALMLSESLDDMNSQMSNMPSCPNGKNKKNQGDNGSPSMQTLKDLQQQLKEQMEKMKEEQGKGNSHGMTGGKKNSEQFAKMAMQQEAIRRQLEQMQQELRSSGQSLDGELQKAIQQMEQNEVDLINKRITKEMLERQQEIITRMLNHEKAQKEREKDNQRESKEGKTFDRKSPEEIFNNKDKDVQDDELRVITPNLNNYYKQKVDKYRYELQNREQ